MVGKGVYVGGFNNAEKGEQQRAEQREREREASVVAITLCQDKDPEQRDTAHQEIGEEKDKEHGLKIEEVIIKVFDDTGLKIISKFRF